MRQMGVINNQKAFIWRTSLGTLKICKDGQRNQKVSVCHASQAFSFLQFGSIVSMGLPSSFTIAAMSQKEWLA